MFKSRTVFVVGAGASEEAGLPIGKKLTSEIGQLVNFYWEDYRLTRGDEQINELLKRLEREKPAKWQYQRLFAAGRHIAQAMEMALSIDTFLDSFANHEEQKIVAKLAIAKAILSAERSSKFMAREDKPFELRTVGNTWYVSLAQLLFSGVPAETPERAFENVSFVVFNYDRCLQIFLARALRAYFEIPDQHASNILGNVKFLHPYGNLGSIFPGSKDRVPYGESNCNLLAVADGINTFTESARDPEIVDAIREEIRQAETLVFLGFAFHDQNMELLSTKPVERAPAAKRVLATVLDMSKSDTEIVRNLIGMMLFDRPPSVGMPYSIDTFNGKCAPFFAEYWRSLTAS